MEAEDASLPFLWVALPDADVSPHSGRPAVWSGDASADADDDDAGGVAEFNGSSADSSDPDGDGVGWWNCCSSGAGNLLRCDSAALHRTNNRWDGAVDECRDSNGEIYSGDRQP